MRHIGLPRKVLYLSKSGWNKLNFFSWLCTYKQSHDSWPWFLLLLLLCNDQVEVREREKWVHSSLDHHPADLLPKWEGWCDQFVTINKNNSNISKLFLIIKKCWWHKKRQPSLSMFLPSESRRQIYLKIVNSFYPTWEEAAEANCLGLCS